jgi:hypothetical protein
MHVVIHARNRAKPLGTAYILPKRDDPLEGGGFQPGFVFDEQGRRNLSLKTAFPRKQH